MYKAIFFTDRDKLVIAMVPCAIWLYFFVLFSFHISLVLLPSVTLMEKTTDKINTILQSAPCNNKCISALHAL